MNTIKDFSLPDEVELLLKTWFTGVEWVVLNSWRDIDTYYLTVHDNRQVLNFFRIFPIQGTYQLSLDNQWTIK